MHKESEIERGNERQKGRDVDSEKDGRGGKESHGECILTLILYETHLMWDFQAKSLSIIEINCNPINVDFVNSSKILILALENVCSKPKLL